MVWTIFSYRLWGDLKEFTLGCQNASVGESRSLR